MDKLKPTKLLGGLVRCLQITLYCTVLMNSLDNLTGHLLLLISIVFEHCISVNLEFTLVILWSCNMEFQTQLKSMVVVLW